MQTRRRKRRYAAPIGGIFIILALIGVITVVVASIQLTVRVLDNSTEKERIAEIISPVVMFNPAPFERATDIEAIPMLQYSMWATLISERVDSFAYDPETGEMLVPASDLDVAAARLFGGEVELQHQSFGDYENRYYYNAETQVYSVPTLATMLVYSPVVEEITKEEDGNYRALVGYVSPTAWTANLTGDRQATPDKYMYYIMRKISGNDYEIVAVRDVAVNATHYGVEQIQESQEPEEPQAAEEE